MSTDYQKQENMYARKMYILYSVLTGKPLSKSSFAVVDSGAYCVQFPCYQTCDAAWEAKLDVEQALATYKGVEVFGAIK